MNSLTLALDSFPRCGNSDQHTKLVKRATDVFPQQAIAHFVGCESSVSFRIARNSLWGWALSASFAANADVRYDLCMNYRRSTS